MDKNPIELEGYDLTSANALTFWMSANVSSKLIDNGSFNRVLKDEEGNYIGETTKNYYAAYAPIIGEAKITAPVGLCDKAVLYVGDKRYETTGTVISATVPSYTDLNDVRLYIYDDPETENPIGGPTNNGASTYWIYNPDTKTLSISGEGTMCFLYENMYTEYLSAPYSSVDDVPWKEYRDEIEKVVIEPGVTSIANKAFYGCKNLKSIELSDTVTFIGESAFDGCVSLTDINLPNSLKAIYDNAFYFSTGLKSVDLPDSLDTLGVTVFNNCKGLESINVGENNPSFMSVDGVLYNKEQSRLIQYPCNKNAESFEIPDTVTELGESAFNYSTNLKTVKIPETVTIIGNYAFESCTGIEDIVVPNSVTALGDWAFFQCSSLKSATLPDSINALGEYSFYKCEKLEKVSVPQSVQIIGKYAFKECSSLKNIALPSGLTEIGLAAFESCTSLSDIIIPNGITRIEGFLFKDCTNLKYIAIPNNLTSVGDWAFRNCDKLTNVYYTGEQESWSSIVMGESNELLINANIKFNCKSYDYTSISDNTVNLTSDGENKYIAFIADSKGKITVNTTADKEIIAEISDSEGNVLTVEESEALLSAKLTEGNLYIISVKSSEISENTYDINISFAPDSPIEYALGDVNLDGYVDINDVTLTQLYLLGSASLSDDALSLADFNKDNYISIIDATLIQKFIAASGNN